LGCRGHSPIPWARALSRSQFPVPIQRWRIGTRCRRELTHFLADERPILHAGKTRKKRRPHVPCPERTGVSILLMGTGRTANRRIAQTGKVNTAGNGQNEPACSR
jgi:hypothetical protein